MLLLLYALLILALLILVVSGARLYTNALEIPSREVRWPSCKVRWRPTAEREIFLFGRQRMEPCCA